MVFKIIYPFRPYLYVAATEGNSYAVAAYITRKHQHALVEHVEKEDLDLVSCPSFLPIVTRQLHSIVLQKNHLSGLKSQFLKISFPSNHELVAFKKDIMPQIKKNKERLGASSEYTTLLTE